jgi:hypothetical protein
MGWLNVDNKIKTDINCKFFFDENSFEIRYLKELIKNEFPVFSKTQISGAVNESWKSVGFPRPRQKFIFTLKDKLGGDL